MVKTKKARIGKRPPRYAFMLNRYSDVRLSKCPRCRKPTHLRKFALFIHIDEWGPMVLGKSCKYCSRCELIIAHQDELEAQLAYIFSKKAPDLIGKRYLVIGTVDHAVWKKGLKGSGGGLGEIMEHLADFKAVYDLRVEPGGWYPADKSRSGN